jgi:hypothetical protein
MSEIVDSLGREGLNTYRYSLSCPMTQMKGKPLGHVKTRTVTRSHDGYADPANPPANSGETTGLPRVWGPAPPAPGRGTDRRDVGRRRQIVFLRLGSPGCTDSPHRAHIRPDREAPYHYLEPDAGRALSVLARNRADERQPSVGGWAGPTLRCQVRSRLSRLISPESSPAAPTQMQTSGQEKNG